MRTRSALAVALALPLGAYTSLFINATVPTIAKISTIGFSKTDTEFMGRAIPGSLLQLEGFLQLSPKNEDLMLLIADTECGYALGWVEDENPQMASQYYLDGKDLALQALYVKDRHYRKAIDAGQPVREAVKAIVDPKMAGPLFTVGNCWGGWLQQNMTNARALFAVPSITAIMQRVLDLKPDTYWGGAYLFFGAYYSSIPAIAGGGLEKGRKYFDEAFKISDNKFLMVHYLFAKTYATMLKELEDPVSGKTGIQLFDEMLTTIETTDAKAIPDLGLANAIAKEKARKLAQRRAELF